MIDRDDSIEILTRNRSALQSRGVRRAAIFGSVARGEATAASDLDILIEIDPAVRMTIFDYVGVKRAIAALFPCKTDVVDAAALKPGLDRSAERDAVYAF